jgi:hypothetical protein
MIGPCVYLLCGITSALCAGLLLHQYSKTKMRLLLWSGICFSALFLNNVGLFLDLVIYPDLDLSVWRQIPEVIAVLSMLYGLIWELA